LYLFTSHVIETLEVNKICVFSNELDDSNVSALSVAWHKRQIPVFVSDTLREWKEKCKLTDNELVIIKNANTSLVTSVLNLASQRELAMNLWIIISTNSDHMAEVYFSSNTRRLGIQITILFIRPGFAEPAVLVTKIQGTATTSLKFVVRHI
jgi:hypothetical protein